MAWKEVKKSTLVLKTKVAGQTEAVVTRWGWLVPTAESYVLRPPSLFDKKEGEFLRKKQMPRLKMNRIFFQAFFKTHENLNQKFGYRKTTYKSWSLFAECSEMFFCVTLQSKSALWIQEFHVVFLK